MTSLLFFSRELAETFMELQENSVAGFCCKAISFQRINVPDARKRVARLCPARSLTENGKIRQIPAIRTEIGRSR